MEEILYWIEDSINQLETAGRLLQVYIWVSGILLVILVIMVFGISSKLNDNMKIISLIIENQINDRMRSFGLDPEEPEIKRLIVMSGSGNRYHAENAKKELDQIIYSLKEQGDRKNE